MIQLDNTGSNFEKNGMPFAGLSLDVNLESGHLSSFGNFSSKILDSGVLESIRHKLGEMFRLHWIKNHQTTPKMEFTFTHHICGEISGAGCGEDGGRLVGIDFDIAIEDREYDELIDLVNSEEFCSKLESSVAIDFRNLFSSEITSEMNLVVEVVEIGCG